MTILIGITGRDAGAIADTADYLVQEYGFRRHCIQDDHNLDLAQAESDENGIVVADVQTNDQAERVRCRGLLIHLRRAEATADAPPCNAPPLLYRELEDVRMDYGATIHHLQAKVDILLRKIKKGWMYGTSAG
jgi:hypothetical protein